MVGKKIPAKPQFLYVTQGKGVGVVLVVKGGGSFGRRGLKH